MSKKNTEEKTLNVNAKEFRSKEKKLRVLPRESSVSPAGSSTSATISDGISSRSSQTTSSHTGSSRSSQTTAGSHPGSSRSSQPFTITPTGSSRSSQTTGSHTGSSMSSGRQTAGTQWNLDAEEFCSKSDSVSQGKLNARAKEFLCNFQYVVTGFKNKIFKKGTLEHYCFPAPKGKEVFQEGDDFRHIFRGGEFRYFLFKDDEFTRMVLDVTRDPGQILVINGVLSNGHWKISLEESKKQVAKEESESPDKSGEMKTRKQERKEGEKRYFLPINFFPELDLDHGDMVKRDLGKKKDLEETMKSGGLELAGRYNVRHGLSGTSEIKETLEKSDDNGTRVQAFYCEDDPSLTYIVVMQPVDNKEAAFRLELEKGKRDIRIKKKMPNKKR